MAERLKTKPRKWEKNEDWFLRLVYGFEKMEIIVECLDRSPSSIHRRAKQLKLGYQKKKIGSIPLSYYKNIEYKAIRRGHEFTVGINYLADLFRKQKRKCAYSGKRIFFTWADEKQTASLDRKNSKIGYVEGNVQWVHKYVNMAKQSLSHKAFLKMIKDIYNYAC